MYNKFTYKNRRRPSPVAKLPTGEITSDRHYVFSPLSVSKREIRLLRLLPSSTQDLPIACELHTFSLDGELPLYEALSYTWEYFHGYEQKICVDGAAFTVKSNVENALSFLRDAVRDRWMWIDAICINMDEPEERAAQVQSMKFIFSMASKVVVWLADPAAGNQIRYLQDDSPASMLAIRVIQREITSLGGVQSPELLRAYARNFSHQWFTRVWTLQEYALARQTTFSWGTDSTDGLKLAESVKRVWTGLAKAEWTAVLSQKDITEIREALLGFLYFDWVRERYQHGPLDAETFASILAAAQELRATDPRDKIYGLLSLAPPLAVTLKPDYSITALEMYRRVAVAMSLAARVEAIFKDIERDYLANIPVLPMPHWLPSWIDELSLRVSDLLQAESTSRNVYSEAVIECLEISSKNWYRHENPEPRNTTERLRLLPERIAYRDSLHEAAKVLRCLLSQTEPTEEPKIVIELQTATNLSSVDDDFSDSGYSSASSSAQQTSFVADEIATHLLSHSFFRRLILAAAKLETRDNILEMHLRPCIRYLGHELDTMANESEELLVARELKRHAPFIVRAIVSRIRDPDLIESSTLKHERASRITRLLQELAPKYRSRLNNVANDSERLSVEAIVDPDGSKTVASPIQYDRAENDLPMAALNQVKEFMTKESAFVPFLHKVSCIVYSSPLDLVEAEVNHGGEMNNMIQRQLKWSENSPVQFIVDWDMAGFLKRELADSRPGTAFGRFLSLLVISGSVKSCYATNIETYLKWRWPVTSDRLLDSLRACFDNVLGGNAVLFATGRSSPEHAVKIVSGCYGHTLIVNASGDRDHISEIAQQLAWLTAACRKADGRCLSLSQVLFFETGSQVGGRRFQISRVPLKEVKEQEGACWVPLFSGTVIAHDYPTPSRGIENGIELPFDLMKTLAGPLYPINSDEGVYFKAYSRMLYHTAFTEDESSSPPRVQWHYVSTPESPVERPFSLPAAKDYSQYKTLSQLAEARAFLGFCSRAVVDLGTEKSVGYYKDEIRYTELYDESHPTAIGMPVVTIPAGGLPVNPGVGLPTTKRKALMQPEVKDRDYTDAINEAQIRPAILYDADKSSGCGWMVPISCVILHMIHTWSAVYENFPDAYPHMDQSSNAGKAARDVLDSKSNFVLRRSSDPTAEPNKLVRHLVMEFWDSICSKREDDAMYVIEANLNIELGKEKLYGWEFVDIVEGRQTKRRQLHSTTSWGPFADDCILIFCQGLGNVISPAEGVTVCDRWKFKNPGSMDLIATTYCLMELARHKGSRRNALTSLRLTNKGYWQYTGADLFLDCTHSKTEICSKQPQQILKKAVQLTGDPPPAESAVVFGRRTLVKSRPAARGTRSASSSRERLHSLAKRVASPLQRIGRVFSGSTTSTSSLENSEQVLSDQSTNDDQ